MSINNARISIHRPELYGEKFTSNVISFRVEGLNLLSDEIRSISFAADDPALAQLSEAAFAVREAINNENNSPDFVGRVEFTRVSNPDGTEDQIISIKVNETATINGQKIQDILIDHVDKVRSLAQSVAGALSQNSSTHSSENGLEASFQKKTIPPLREVDIDPLYDRKTIFTEFKTKSDTSPKVKDAHLEVSDKLHQKTVQAHGSAMFIVGARPEIKKGLLGMGAETLHVHFSTLGVSSCGDCGGTSSTHSSTKQETQSKLDKKYNGKVKTSMRALPPPRGTYAVLA